METITQNADRVVEATPPTLNERIEDSTWEHVAKYAYKGSAAITERIQELDNEWDIERYLGVNMSAIALIGLIKGVGKTRWLVLPAVVLGFYMQHSIKGWCPPLPLLRALKIRTRKEIEQEKYALKVIRGDFEGLQFSAAPDTQKLKAAITKD